MLLLIGIQQIKEGGQVTEGRKLQPMYESRKNIVGQASREDATFWFLGLTGSGEKFAALSNQLARGTSGATGVYSTPVPLERLFNYIAKSVRMRSALRWDLLG